MENDKNSEYNENANKETTEGNVKNDNSDIERKKKVSKLLMFPGFVSGIANYNDD